MLDGRYGSFSDLDALDWEVRSSPNNRHVTTASACPKGANRRHLITAQRATFRTGDGSEAQYCVKQCKQTKDADERRKDCGTRPRDRLILAVGRIFQSKGL